MTPQTFPQISADFRRSDIADVAEKCKNRRYLRVFNLRDLREMHLVTKPESRIPKRRTCSHKNRFQVAGIGLDLRHINAFHGAIATLS